MKLWHLDRAYVHGHPCDFSGAVVAAETEQDARELAYTELVEGNSDANHKENDFRLYSEFDCEEIGTSLEDEARVILADYWEP
jgi:hypothetical protein